MIIHKENSKNFGLFLLLYAFAIALFSIILVSIFYLFFNFPLSLFNIFSITAFLLLFFFLFKPYLPQIFRGLMYILILLIGLMLGKFVIYLGFLYFTLILWFIKPITKLITKVSNIVA